MLGDLPRTALVNYKETINGVDYDVQYMVFCTASENPYGNDCCLMLRLRATGRCWLLDERLKFSDNGSTEYKNSVLDDFLTNEYVLRFDENFLQAVKTSDVKCFSNRDESAYMLRRQFFALSLNELGTNVPYDPSDNLCTFQSNIYRIAYLSDGITRASYWSRSPASDSTVGYVNYGGGLYTFNPAGNVYARPSFNLDSSTLVASEPNEDGSYDLIFSPEKEIVIDPAKFESSFALLLS